MRLVYYLLKLVELFLHNINNSPQVTSYLYNNPFTYENLEFIIFISNKDGSMIYHPNVGVVSLTQNGIVSFRTYEPGKNCKYLGNEKETYEEAYKIATQGDSVFFKRSEEK